MPATVLTLTQYGLAATKGRKGKTYSELGVLGALARANPVSNTECSIFLPA
jgi:hypothetical protein